MLCRWGEYDTGWCGLMTWIFGLLLRVKIELEHKRGRRLRFDSWISYLAQCSHTGPLKISWGLMFEFSVDMVILLVAKTVTGMVCYMVILGYLGTSIASFVRSVLFIKLYRVNILAKKVLLVVWNGQKAWNLAFGMLCTQCATWWWHIEIVEEVDELIKSPTWRRLCFFSTFTNAGKHVFKTILSCRPGLQIHWSQLLNLVLYAKFWCVKLST